MPPQHAATRKRADSLRFQVVDGTGKPLAGALVSDRGRVLGHTDPRGRWEQTSPLEKFDSADPTTYVDRFTARHGSSPTQHLFFRIGPQNWWAMIVPEDVTAVLCTLDERPLAEVLVRVVPAHAPPPPFVPEPRRQRWLLPEQSWTGRPTVTGESILPGTRFAPRFRFVPIAQATTTASGLAVFTDLPKGSPRAIVDHAIHVRGKALTQRHRCDPVELERGKVTEVAFTRVLHAIVSGQGDELLELLPMQGAPQRSAVAWTDSLRPSLLRMLDRLQARFPKSCVVLQAEDAESIPTPWIHARWRKRPDTEGHDIPLRPLDQGWHKLTLRPIRPATPKAVGELIVRVLDATGAPLRGEQLEIREGNKPSRRWLADEPLWVPPGMHRFAPVAKSLAKLGGGFQEIVCPAGRRIEAVYQLPRMVRVRFDCGGLRADADRYRVTLSDATGRSFESFTVGPTSAETVSAQTRWLPADRIKAEITVARLVVVAGQAEDQWAGFEQTFDFSEAQGPGVRTVKIDWPADLPAAKPLELPGGHVLPSWLHDRAERSRRR